MKYERKLKDLCVFSMEETRKALVVDLRQYVNTMLPDYAPQDALYSLAMSQHWIKKDRKRSDMHTIHIRDRREARQGYPFNGFSFWTLCGITVPHDHLAENQPDTPEPAAHMQAEDPTCEGCILMKLDPDVRKTHD